MARLIFGDDECIKRKREADKYKELRDLYKIVKCPLCGSNNAGHTSLTYDRKKVGWAFECHEWCPAKKIELYTDMEGNFLK